MIFLWPDNGTKRLPSRLLTAENHLAAEEAPGQRINQRWLFMTSLSVQIPWPNIPIRNNFPVKQQAFQIPWNFQYTEVQLYGCKTWKETTWSSHLEETRLALSGTYITLLGKLWVWEVNSGTSAPSQHHWCRVGTHHFLFQVWWSLDRVSCLQIPKIHSAYIVLKEYCQLTCWIVGHPGSDAFQKLFWCHSMVYIAKSHRTFPTQGLRRGFRMHTELSLSSLFFPVWT
jgi:hypothetical protein